MLLCVVVFFPQPLGILIAWLGMSWIIASAFSGKMADQYAKTVTNYVVIAISAFWN